MRELSTLWQIFWALCYSFGLVTDWSPKLNFPVLGLPRFIYFIGMLASCFQVGR